MQILGPAQISKTSSATPTGVSKKMPVCKQKQAEGVLCILRQAWVTIIITHLHPKRRHYQDQHKDGIALKQVPAVPEAGIG